MLTFLKRYKNEIILFTLLLIVFFATRLYQLGQLPIFTDEAIYVRWAQIAKQDAAWRFISLTDGKQPSFIWAMMLTLKLFEDPVVAGRIISVIAGFISVIGMFFLGREVFKNHTIGILASALYVVYPMAVVYDRMALYDSLVGAFTIWSLYITVLLVRNLRLDTALILGMVLGGGVLTKSNAFFSIYLLPFSLLLFDWKKKDRWSLVLKWIGLALIATVLAYGFYTMLRLSPYFHIIGQKNEIFVHSISEWITHPFRDTVSNLRGLLDWLIVYFSWPFIILVFVSLVVQRKYFFEKVLLIVWFLAPFVALTLLGKLIYPRYILFMTLPLLPLVAYALYWLIKNTKRKFVAAALVFGVLVLPIRADYMILTDLGNAPIPKLDKDQYINEWPAGGGVREAVTFFKEQASREKIFIATEGTFGLMPYALEIYLHDNPNVRIFGFWPVGRPPVEMVEASKHMKTYVLFYQPCPTCEYSGDGPNDWPLKKVIETKKGNGKATIAVYEVLP